MSDTETTEDRRGGAREGAGRPVGEHGKRVTVTLSLPEKTRKRLDKDYASLTDDQREQFPSKSKYVTHILHLYLDARDKLRKQRKNTRQKKGRGTAKRRA